MNFRAHRTSRPLRSTGYLLLACLIPLVSHAQVVKQVLLDVRLIEAQSNFLKSLGYSWSSPTGFTGVQQSVQAPEIHVGSTQGYTVNFSANFGRTLDRVPLVGHLFSALKPARKPLIGYAKIQLLENDAAVFTQDFSVLSGGPAECTVGGLRVRADLYLGDFQGGQFAFSYKLEGLRESDSVKLQALLQLNTWEGGFAPRKVQREYVTDLLPMRIRYPFSFTYNPASLGTVVHGEIKKLDLDATTHSERPAVFAFAATANTGVEDGIVPGADPGTVRTVPLVPGASVTHQAPNHPTNPMVTLPVTGDVGGGIILLKTFPYLWHDDSLHFLPFTYVCKDTGAGMAEALGVRFLDRAGKPIARGGAALSRLDRIDASALDPRLSRVAIVAAVDVSNPLTGSSGAAAVYGPQKGLRPEDLPALDHALRHFARIAARDCGLGVMELPGAGAAGGLGAGAVLFLHAQLRPGIEIVLDALHFDDELRWADLVLTGEGSLDTQTLHGKVISGLLTRAKRFNVPVAAIAGKTDLSDSGSPAPPLGLADLETLVDSSTPLELAIQNAGLLLRQRTKTLLLRHLSH